MSVSISETPDFITLHSYPQAIVHIDCDAFFTSCEQSRNPRLKGLPLATGKERGIVSCPSYEAKAAGVVRGMRLGEAKKACPKLITLPSDYELYSIYSERVFAIIRKFTPDVEEYSIDEAFCDLTGLRRIYRASYSDIAYKIKQDIQKALGITVSVGLSLSKILAKICSKQNKPDGFLAMPGSRLHEFLPKIALERVCGFGPNTVSLLQKCGVKSVFDYVKRPRAFAEKMLGKIGVELWLELRGEYIYKISTEQKSKYLTISKTKTFMPASGNRDLVKGQLIRNLESACIKLRRHNLSAKAIAVYLRKSDFTGYGVEGCINRHSSSTLDFTNVCYELFKRVFEENCVYRATGVVFSDIVPEGRDSSDLFEDPVRIERMQKISTAIDSINSTYGKHAIHIASSQIINQKGSHPRNCLAWRTQELLKGETFRRRLGIPLLKLK
jgi:DNA polymerase IV